MEPSVFLAQLFCKPKTSPKNNVYFFKESNNVIKKKKILRPHCPFPERFSQIPTVRKWCSQDLNQNSLDHCAKDS